MRDGSSGRRDIQKIKWFIAAAVATSFLPFVCVKIDCINLICIKSDISVDVAARKVEK